MPEFVSDRKPDYIELRFEVVKLRKLRGWTLDDLAEASGVARRTIVQIESGKSTGSVGTWFRLAEAFDITIGEMLAPLYGRSRER